MIDHYYHHILTQLQQGSRGLVSFSTDEKEQLTLIFNQTLEQNNSQDLEKILCLLDHCGSDHLPWEKPLLKTLGLRLPPKLTVFALNCSRKHIIQARYKRGSRLTFEYLEILKNLLFSPFPEVVEWTLRTIEECGPQGVYFLREFDKIKPPPWKWFNAHHRAIREIIAMLERRWSRFEKR
jgi:hypothetical protein